MTDGLQPGDVVQYMRALPGDVVECPAGTGVVLRLVDRVTGLAKQGMEWPSHGSEHVEGVEVVVAGTVYVLPPDAVRFVERRGPCPGCGEFRPLAHRGTTVDVDAICQKCLPVARLTARALFEGGDR